MPASSTCAYLAEHRFNLEQELVDLIDIQAEAYVQILHTIPELWPTRCAIVSV